MSRDLNQEITALIKSSPIFLFMKGNKLWPQCGYSGRVVDLLNYYGIDFETFDILSDPEIRQAVKEFSKWPTFPQLYVNGELIGGCDILMQLHKNNELEGIFKSVS